MRNLLAYGALFLLRRRCSTIHCPISSQGAGNSIKSLLCEQQDYLGDASHVQCTTRKTVNSRRTRKKVTLRKETDVVVK